MTHEMKLRPDPFVKIQSSSKTIELRLYDEKRRQIQVGDTIVFTNTDAPDMKLTTKVIGLHQFPSFAKLFEALPISICGYAQDTTVEDAVGEMREYYPKEREEKFGVLGIEIQVIN